jgi:FkbM family methyltransferase
MKTMSYIIGRVGRRFRMLASEFSARAVGDGSRKTIRIGKNSFTVFGASDDEYFRTLQAQVENFPALLSYASKNLRPDGVVFDIGANIGLTVLMLCNLVPHGHVYAFEASPINARFLRKNIEANGIENCTVYETALGNKTGEVALSTSGAGSHIMTEAHLYYGQRPSSIVPVTTIDLAVAKLPIDRIDLIKMDIEGSEPMAIEGANETITKFKPAIFMEFNSWSLYFAHKVDPLTFARKIFERFSVSTVRENGSLVTLTDYARFLHDNMTRNGCVDDVVLTLK